MSYTSLDLALKTMRDAGPELRNGAPNHGPMVVEALSALGRDDAVERWLEGYRPRLAPAAKSDAALDCDWREALGDFSRLGQWRVYFRGKIAEAPWKEVIGLWLPRLIRGSMAVGTHGTIRCGHAARALEMEVTEPRHEELACALAYCAARYRRFSSEPRLTGSLDVEDAVAGLPFLDPTIDRTGAPPLVVKHLEKAREFSVAVGHLAAPADISAALSRLAEVGARFYLRNAERHPLVLLHAVTGPAALRLLLPYLSPEDRATAFAYMWQAVAAWAAAFGRQDQTQVLASGNAEWETLTDRAVASGDEHAIKLTEAARREEAVYHSPLFHAAAADWVERVTRSRTWTPAERINAGISTRLSAGSAADPQPTASGPRGS